MWLKFIVLKRHCVGVMGTDRELGTAYTEDAEYSIRKHYHLLAQRTDMQRTLNLSGSAWLRLPEIDDRWLQLLHLVGLCTDVGLRVFETRDGAVAEAAHYRHECIEVLQL